MNFLVNDSIIKALSWTFIHSLWIGLAAALLAGLTLLLTKKATSGTRYNLLAVLSIAFLVATGFIFYSEFETQTPVLQADNLVKTDFQTGHPVTASDTVIMEEGSTPFSADAETGVLPLTIMADNIIATSLCFGLLFSFSNAFE